MNNTKQNDIEVDEKKVNEIGKKIKEYERECFQTNESSEIKKIKKIIEGICK